MTPEFDPNWPHGWQTRTENPVRIYATDGGGENPLHIAVRLSGGWFNSTRKANGKYNLHSEDPADIINAPTPVVREVRWIGISRLDAGSNYHDRSDVGSNYNQHLRLTFENDRCVEVNIFDKDQVDE